METWAQARQEGAQYICVCVDAQAWRICRVFASMFCFQEARNAFIPGRQYMPVGYGQLGCSGFIIVDAKGNFISRRTKAFLDHGEEAFRDVERLVNKELQRYEQDEKTRAEKRKLVESSTAQPDLSRTKTVAPIKSIECPTRVGVVTMDQEHEECTAALNALLIDPSRTTLEKAIHVLEAHFLHEEDLLRKNEFGIEDDPFSPLFSHKKDHDRILQIGRDLLDSGSTC